MNQMVEILPMRGATPAPGMENLGNFLITVS